MKKLLAMLICCMMLVVGCGGSEPKKPQAEVKAPPEITATDKENVIPRNLVPVTVMNQVIYLPEEFKRVDLPSNATEAGIALGGVVHKKNPGVAKIENVYDIAVFFEKNDAIAKIKSGEEKEILEEVYKNAQIRAKQQSNEVTKYNLISKDIVKTVDGRPYLRVVAIIGNHDKPKYDMTEYMGIYLLDDAVFMVVASPMVSANGKHDKEINTILNTFGSKKVVYSL